MSEGPDSLRALADEIPDDPMGLSKGMIAHADAWEAERSGSPGGSPAGAWELVRRKDEFYQARIEALRGALADIAFSGDITLEVAKAKAKRIYEGEGP